MRMSEAPAVPHVHISKVLRWGLDADLKFTGVQYGCTECDEVSDSPFVTIDEGSPHDWHGTYVEGCFGCKAATLELSPGDALSGRIMPQKRWDGELSAYRRARAQGIQPAGTGRRLVEEAVEASERMGLAYNAEKMPAAKRMTETHGSVLTELGV